MEEKNKTFKEKIAYEQTLIAKSKDLIEFMDYGDELSLPELFTIMVRIMKLLSKAGANKVKFESMLKKAKTEYKKFLNKELSGSTDRIGYGKLIQVATDNGKLKVLETFNNNLQKLEDRHNHAMMEWDVLTKNLTMLQSIRNILQGSDHPGLLSATDRRKNDV